jgi:hypothetical protein
MLLKLLVAQRLGSKLSHVLANFLVGQGAELLLVTGEAARLRVVCRAVAQGLVALEVAAEGEGRRSWWCGVQEGR